VRSWRQRWLQVGHGAPPRAADGRGRRGVARARAVLGSPVRAPQAVAASGASAAPGGSPLNGPREHCAAAVARRYASVASA
ncbi:MAG: hypothetical protein DRI56_13395, partial [Chloroflexota bacterium]